MNSLFLGAEAVDAMAGVSVTGTNHDRRPTGLSLFIGGVGIMLALKTHGAAERIGDTLLSLYSAVEEVAYIELDTGFGGEYRHHDARLGIDYLGCRTLQIAACAEHHIMVISVAVLKLSVVSLDISAQCLGSAEVEGSALY